MLLLSLFVLIGTSYEGCILLLFFNRLFRSVNLNFRCKEYLNLYQTCHNFELIHFAKTTDFIKFKNVVLNFQGIKIWPSLDRWIVRSLAKHGHLQKFLEKMVCRAVLKVVRKQNFLRFLGIFSKKSVISDQTNYFS